MLALIAAGAAACTRGDARPALDWTLRVEPLASPAGPASAQPQLTASEHGLVLSWLENAGSTTTFKFSERTATGWSDARPIVSGSDFFANWADVPSVVRLADRTLVAHWLQQSGPESYAYDVQLTRSSDDGRTWSPGFSPHHDGTKNEHGFASLFDVRGAGLGLIWLDGRAMKPSETPGEDAVGDMSLRAARLRPGLVRTFRGRDRRAGLRMLSDGRGRHLGRGRHRLPRSEPGRNSQYLRGEARRGQVDEPAPVHDDGWRINGCPVNGPALSAAGRDVAIAWFTVQEDRGQALVAFSQDAGQTFGAPIRVDDAGSLGRVDVELMLDGSAAVSWIELAGQQAAFKVRRVERTGQRSAAVTVTDIGANRNSGYPRMARRGAELVFAWTGTDDSLRVQTAAARSSVKK